MPAVTTVQKAHRNLPAVHGRSRGMDEIKKTARMNERTSLARERKSQNKEIRATPPVDKLNVVARSTGGDVGVKHISAGELLYKLAPWGHNFSDSGTPVPCPQPLDRRVPANGEHALRLLYLWRQGVLLARRVSHLRFMLLGANQGISWRRLYGEGRSRRAASCFVTMDVFWVRKEWFEVREAPYEG